MNHELIMLKGVMNCKRIENALAKESLTYALRTFSSLAGESTLNEMKVLAEFSMQRERYQTFIFLVKQALADMPRDYRALLVAVYVKQVSKNDFCARSKVSVSTLYRKLAKARKCFKNKLESLGCDEKWFVDTYGDIGWIRKMLCAKQPRMEL